MPLFSAAIAKFKEDANQRSLTCCFFVKPNRDLLLQALTDYDDLNPTSEQLESVINAVIQKRDHPAFTALLDQFYEISKQHYTNHEKNPNPERCSEQLQSVDERISLWLILNHKHSFQLDEKAEKTLRKEQETLTGLKQMNQLFYTLDFHELLEQANLVIILEHHILMSILHSIHQARLLNRDNFDQILKLTKVIEGSKANPLGELNHLFEEHKGMLLQPDLDRYISQANERSGYSPISHAWLQQKVNEIRPISGPPSTRFNYSSSSAFNIAHGADTLTQQKKIQG